MTNFSEEWRYEKKFLVNHMNLSDIKRIIRLNTFNFTKIYPDRFVNNIYFDDMKLSNYFDNIEGNTDRHKVRMRWYGGQKDFNEKVYLEVKRKKGEIGFKERFVLNNFNYNGDLKNEFCKIKKELKNKPQGLYLFNLNPSLVNSYTREYYLSNNKDFRLTLDYDLEYRSIFNNQISKLQIHKLIDHFVLELKYNTSVSSIANIITNQFPFRLTKSSKYIIGIDKVKTYFF